MDPLDVVTIVGAAAVVAGIAMLSVPVALIFAGLVTIFAARGYAIDRKKAAGG